MEGNRGEHWKEGPARENHIRSLTLRADRNQRTSRPSRSPSWQGTFRVVDRRERRERLRFIGASDEHDRMLRGEQNGWQQRDSMRVQFLHVDGGCEVGAVVNQGLAWKETGGVRVRTHAAVNDVELRNAFTENEAQLVDVDCGGVLGYALGFVLDGYSCRGISRAQARYRSRA